MEYISHLTAENSETAEDFPTLVYPEDNGSESTLNGCNSMMNCHSILKEQLTSSLKDAESAGHVGDGLIPKQEVCCVETFSCSCFIVSMVCLG